MHCNGPAPAAERRSGRPAFEVAEVFHAHGEAYRQRYRLSGDQLKVMRDIEACRTALLGGHLDVCSSCDYQAPSYNSCRNRHCPKCQAIAQARWIEGRLERVLPTSYFHVVFTLPAELRALALRNRILVFNLLFAAASQTLLALGEDPKRLGAQLGITCVLHTWTRELTFHPHLHCIVTGGGLSASAERWVSVRKKYLFSVKVTAKLFRGKFLDVLAGAYKADRLTLDGSLAHLKKPAAFGQFLRDLYNIDWNVYSKPTLTGPEQVFRYLGRYTHRIGLSNQRIQSIDERGIRFVTKGKNSLLLEPEEFIRRFLLHVLPSGFVKIRHYGLHASKNAKTKLVLARTLLIAAFALPSTPTEKLPQTWQEILFKLTGVDPSLCPQCGAKLGRVPLSEALPAFTPSSTTWLDTS